MPETEACLSHMSTLTCACKGRDGVGAFGRASRPHRSLQLGARAAQWRVPSASRSLGAWRADLKEARV